MPHQDPLMGLTTLVMSINSYIYNLYIYIYRYWHIFTYICIYLHIFTFICIYLHIFPTCWNLYLHTDILSVVVSAKWTPTKGPSRWSLVLQFRPTLFFTISQPSMAEISATRKRRIRSISSLVRRDEAERKPWVFGGGCFYLRG